MVLPSLAVTLKERLWPLSHPVFEPLMDTDFMSPEPPTFVISTKLKYECPLTVYLMPPFFTHETLQTLKKTPLKYENRDDSGSIFGDLQESRFGQIKVFTRGIAPPTIQAPQLKPLLKSAVLKAASKRLKLTHCAGSISTTIEGGMGGLPTTIIVSVNAMECAVADTEQAEEEKRKHSNNWLTLMLAAMV
ncbi:hypothetical protein GQ457_09G012770 [Hibiscus cannabinus]